MHRFVYIQRHELGPRVFIGGQRVHHGATGTLVLLVGAALRSRAAAACGAALILHDLHDWKIWFRREVRALTEALDSDLAIP